jgi:hypothetical protein
VKGGDEKPPGAAEHFFDAFAHLARGFVGEGKCKDVSGLNPLADEMSDSPGDDPRLPAACAGENQERATHVFDGLGLRRVYFIQDCFST